MNEIKSSKEEEVREMSNQKHSGGVAIESQDALGRCPFCGAAPSPDIPTHVGWFIVQHKEGCWLGRHTKPNGNWQELYISECKAWNTRSTGVDRGWQPEAERVLGLCEKALRSLPTDGLGQDPEGWFYRDELLSHIARVLPSSPDTLRTSVVEDEND